jgi:hypothetical protein
MQEATAKLCRHCNRAKVNRPRGLCWTCYYTPGVKDLYPSTSRYARRGIGNGYSDKPASVPTDAAPGSPEKLAVIADRVKSRESTSHPDDTAIKSGGTSGDFDGTHHFALPIDRFPLAAFDPFFHSHDPEPQFR